MKIRDALSIPLTVGPPARPDPVPLSPAAAERLLAEGVERLNALARELKIGPGSLHRWVRRGLNGVRLEALWGAKGKGYATSREAVARFLAAATAARERSG